MAKKPSETAEPVEHQNEPSETAESVELVKMFRRPEFAGNGPTTADVDPSEVANFKLGGWQEVE